jgi:two-component system chemotaxis response regulator CheY
MKKVLIAQDLHVLLQQDKTFLNRTDFTVFTMATNDEALNIHRRERVNLIITNFDMPGMDSQQFCSRIREDKDLRAVSMIMVCPNTPEAIEQSARCRVNAVLLQPVHPLLLMVKAQQLLDIAARETLRVLLNASIDGSARNTAFFCRSRNVSATGMLIETNKQFAEGARLSCLFYLPNSQKIEAKGKIIRTKGQALGAKDNIYGLMFTDITPEVKQALLDFVESSSHKPGPVS